MGQHNVTLHLPVHRDNVVPNIKISSETERSLSYHEVVSINVFYRVCQLGLLVAINISHECSYSTSLGTDFEFNTCRQGVKADRRLSVGQGMSRNSCKMRCQKKKGDNKFASLHGKRQRTKIS